MGDIVDAIMKTMNIDEDTIELEELIAKFDGYYGARKKKVIVARAKFNKRTQNSEEPVEFFIQHCTNSQRIVNINLLKKIQSEKESFLVCLTMHSQTNFKPKKI